jgi:hypothetical protein
MSRSLLLILAVFICCVSNSYSQSTPQLKDAVYHRSSVTYIYESYNGKYRQLIKQAMPNVGVPTKFDDNRLIKPVISQINESAMSESAYNSELVNALQQNKIPNKIIAKWFNRKSDGSFNMDLVLKRGNYDANDADVLKALSMQRGLSAIDQEAMKLVESSYILVIDIKKVQSLDEAYEMRDNILRAYAKQFNVKYIPVKRVMNGFKAQVEYRLYQVNFNDSIAAIFYRNLWIDPFDPADIKSKRKTDFDNFYFPLIYKFRTELNISGTQLNPGIPFAPVNQATDSELMVEMLKNGVDNFITSVEKVIPKFRIRASIISTKPIEANIGLKEGLKTDQRYFVYQDKMNKKGEIKSNRMGVIRVKHVADNRENSSGDSKSTQFYQIAGNGLGTGMIAEQHHGANMGFSVGYNFLGDIKGVEFRLDYNLSSLFAAISPDGNTITGFKAYAEIGIDVQQYKSEYFRFYDIDNIYEETVGRDNDELYQARFGFIRMGLGLSKSFQLSKNVAIAPEFGWNYEIAIANSMQDESGTDVSLNKITNVYSQSGASSNDVANNLQYSVHYIIVGAELTINIAYPLQLYGKLDLFGPVTPTLDRDNKLYNQKWYDFFNERGGMTIGGGIRLEF